MTNRNRRSQAILIGPLARGHIHICLRKDSRPLASLLEHQHPVVTVLPLLIRLARCPLGIGKGTPFFLRPIPSRAVALRGIPPDSPPRNVVQSGIPIVVVAVESVIRLAALVHGLAHHPRDAGRQVGVAEDLWGQRSDEEWQAVR